jgi:ATP-dependent helicase/DNAse subunit B
MKNMEHIMQKCVSNISYQLGKGRFIPKEYEVSFHVVENLKDLDVSLSDKDKMRLSGRIDRMDTCEKDDRAMPKNKMVKIFLILLNLVLCKFTILLLKSPLCRAL